MPGTDLPALKARRGSLRATVTRADNYLDSINNETEIDSTNLKHRAARLERILDEIIEVQEAIQLLEPSEMDEIVDFENKYFAVCSKFNKMINQCEPNVVTVDERNNQTGNASIKLPQVNLPRFSGAFDEWLPFFNTFKSMVHECSSLNNLQRFHYLLSSVSGEAAEVLSSFDLCAENYHPAWNLLIDNFDNKRRITQKHVQAIFELPSTKTESAEIMRQIIRGLSKHTRALNSLGRPTDNWDDLLIHIVTQKLDNVTIKV